VCKKHAEKMTTRAPPPAMMPISAWPIEVVQKAELPEEGCCAPVEDEEEETGGVTAADEEEEEEGTGVGAEHVVELVSGTAEQGVERKQLQVPSESETPQLVHKTVELPE
jgi:hypothetical protein